MEYLIGVVLGLTVAGSAAVIGLDRGRVFYPTVLMVTATYYVLFAVMGASGRVLAIEIAVATGFLFLAILGFKKNLWLVVAAFVGHGVFDLVHRFVVENPGVPYWWPGFCSRNRWNCGSLVGSALHEGPTHCGRTGLKNESRLEVTAAMSFLELKIPPVAVTLVTALAMWLVAGSVPSGAVFLPARDTLRPITGYCRSSDECPRGGRLPASKHDRQPNQTRTHIVSSAVRCLQFDQKSHVFRLSLNSVRLGDPVSKPAGLPSPPGIHSHHGSLSDPPRGKGSRREVWTGIHDVCRSRAPVDMAKGPATTPDWFIFFSEILDR